MNLIQVFAAGTLAATSLALAIGLSLRAPLRPLLIELCGGEARARFWNSFALIGMVLSALFGATLAAPTGRQDLQALIAAERDAPAFVQEFPAFHVFVSTFSTGLLGLLMAVAFLGAVLLIAIFGYQTRGRREAPRPLPPSA